MATSIKARDHRTSRTLSWLIAGAALPAVLTFVVGMTVSPALLGAATETAPGENTSTGATYVPDGTCAGCHDMEAKAWSTSHHAHAMEPPSGASVRGDFGEVTFETAQAAYRFFRRDDKYFVETEGPDGKAAEFEIAYTFGWTPLQQYLVELDDGRLQALTVAWDTEANHWFDLADEPAAPGDPLHWTGREYNWNFRCADCHSTNLIRNYDLEADSYETTFSSVNVGCEACHGPGSDHVTWAENHPADAPYDDADLGLVTDLRETSGNQIETCAQCHSRRRQITDHFVAGEPFIDHYMPELLEDGLYFADGQIDDEVYVYGSFLQSRMFRSGVVCSDCHDPHSGQLVAEGNAVCTACHNETPPQRFPNIVPLDYDSPGHHFHETGEPGSFCVDCHMPARTYMVVDPRRDHSFRVPRPDLSAATGSPDACTGCHDDAAWAAAQIAAWYGPGRRQEPHFGEALAAGRSGAPGAGESLAALAGDLSQPGIARATAVEMLQRYLDDVTGPALETAFGDPDPLVRIAALQALQSVEPDARLQFAAPLLKDRLRSVRVAAARALAPVAIASFADDRRAAYESAVDEFIASELAAAERPESHLNLGIYWTERGETAKAETEYRTALRLAPGFAPALANLAELQRAKGLGDEEAELLERAFELAPGDATVQHALGLLRIRQKRYVDALPLLREAAGLAPESARYAYVYAVALESLGQLDQARKAYETALERHPYDIDLLTGFLRLQMGAGARQGALDTVNRLLALRPNDSELSRLKTMLEGS